MWYFRRETRSYFKSILSQNVDADRKKYRPYFMWNNIGSNLYAIPVIYYFVFPSNASNFSACFCLRFYLLLALVAYLILKVMFKYFTSNSKILVIHTRYWFWYCTLENSKRTLTIFIRIYMQRKFFMYLDSNRNRRCGIHWLIKIYC